MENVYVDRRGVLVPYLRLFPCRNVILLRVTSSSSLARMERDVDLRVALQIDETCFI